MKVQNISNYQQNPSFKRFSAQEKAVDKLYKIAKEECITPEQYDLFKDGFQELYQYTQNIQWDNPTNIKFELSDKTGRPYGKVLEKDVFTVSVIAPDTYDVTPDGKKVIQDGNKFARYEIDLKNKKLDEIIPALRKGFTHAENTADKITEAYKEMQASRAANLFEYVEKAKDDYLESVTDEEKGRQLAKISDILGLKDTIEDELEKIQLYQDQRKFQKAFNNPPKSTPPVYA